MIQVLKHRWQTAPNVVYSSILRGLLMAVKFHRQLFFSFLWATHQFVNHEKSRYFGERYACIFISLCVRTQCDIFFDETRSILSKVIRIKLRMDSYCKILFHAKRSMKNSLWVLWFQSNKFCIIAHTIGFRFSDFVDIQKSNCYCNIVLYCIVFCVAFYYDSSVFLLTWSSFLLIVRLHPTCITLLHSLRWALSWGRTPKHFSFIPGEYLNILDDFGNQWTYTARARERFEQIFLLCWSSEQVVLLSAALKLRIS